MKLIGSAVEEQYKRELQEGARYLLEERGDPGLLQLLNQEVGVVESTYYLGGYTLQDYHTCTLLVNGNVIFYIEMSNEQIEHLNAISVAEYKKGLKKQGQIKLQVALELAALK